MTIKIERNDEYVFEVVEQKYKRYWDEIGLYTTGDDPDKPNYYILDFFPYPSGSGLSVGHCRNYVPTCVDARFHRMRGYNVLHPMGWDAFGLPAENYAIKHGINPRQTTAEFSANYKRQMTLAECSYDWSREIDSTDPDYYRWTQWFFRLLFQRGLAYQAIGSQWWCPQCQTILANEQVENGRCWRCDSIVEKKDLQQWYFKITEYADRLLADLDTIDWPEHIKLMQRNWIGRSEGAEVIFTVSDHEIPVFTTRPDTLYGATFLVLAPEHPLVAEIVTDEWETAVSAYVQQAQRMTEMDRMTADKEKTGIFTGAYAIHPLTGVEIPIWVADYVLMGYGTGAIMAVPAHDTRDYAFAQKYDLPIVPVIETGEDVTAYGMMINSGPYTGMTSQAGGAKITADLAAQGKGQARVSYKIRDWLISRQRYWGAPIPIIHCAECGPVAVPEEDLPVLLPDMADFAPSGDGRSPLARATEWVNTTCPQCGGAAQRETDTMDGFACSSWYFLRFPNPHYKDGPFDPEAVQKWLPVDTYVGGAEHAVMHLLYARFWTKVMYDAGMVSFVEPFAILKNQGVLSSPLDGRRMSKSRGNVITPDEVVAVHGADALRAYVLFLGPFDADVIWDDTGIVGITRFLRRFWKLANEVGNQYSVISNQYSVKSEQSPISKSEATQSPVSSAFERKMHQAIQQMTYDMEHFRFNTALATMMTYLNTLSDAQSEAISAAQWRQAITAFTILLSPICPFMTEAVWQEVLGYSDSVHQQSWPIFDADKAAEEQVTVIVQVNGRLRDRIVMAADVSEDVMRETAVASPNIQHHINGSTIRKIIVVPGKLVNIVV